MSDVDWLNALAAAAVLRDAAADIDFTLGSGSPGDATLDEVVKVMMLVDGTIGVLRHAYDSLHATANTLMEDNDQTIPGVASLHRGWTRRRSAWDNDALRRNALRVMRDQIVAEAVDPETGERTHTWDQAVTALSTLYNLAGYNARVTALRDLGLDVGDYSVQGPWQPRIEITPEGAEPDDDA